SRRVVGRSTAAMGTTSGRVLLLLAAIAAHQAAAFGEMKEQVMVGLPIDSTGFCFRLLNATHEFGCGASKNGDEGVIVVARSKVDVEGARDGWKERFPNYKGGFVMLMDELLLNGETAPLLISSDRVSGVLLMPTKEGETVDKNLPLSGEPACPNRQSSLYSDWRACGSSRDAKQWNEKGAMMEQGMRFTQWTKPLNRVLNETVLETMIKCHDAYNLPEAQPRADKVEGRLCAVSIKIFNMASGSSTECIRRQTEGIVALSTTRKLCDPLADLNVFGVFPPGVQNKTGSGEYLAILARMDGVATVSDSAPATYGTMTSVVAALTAAKVIGDNLDAFEKASANSNKRVLFAFLHGESFDYVGSSRWVYDMEHGAFPKQRKRGDAPTEVPELISLDKIWLAMELQQIDESMTLHAHVDGKNHAADEKGKIKKLLVHMKKKMGEDGYNLQQERVNNNGVLPPSSLHSILKARRQTPSVLVTSFNEQYRNLRYHSTYDRITRGKEEEEKVKKAIKAVAEGVVAVMAEHVGIDMTQREKIKIDEKWLSTLSECFLATTKIPTCSYFQAMLKNTTSEGAKLDRSTFISAGHQSLVRHLINKLMIIATGEHNSTLNVRDEESCKHVDVKQGLYEYEWQFDPVANDSFCWRTSVFIGVAESPAFIPNEKGVLDIAGRAANYSTWTESVFTIGHEYQLFLVESRPADWTLLMAGLITTLFAVLIVGRCDESSFIVDEGERAAEEGEPL
ncbi:hypothetical protein PENTCL1PPCAC_21851, partial [Pristionchus entomophagus]